MDVRCSGDADGIMKRPATSKRPAACDFELKAQANSLRAVAQRLICESDSLRAQALAAIAEADVLDAQVTAMIRGKESISTLPPQANTPRNEWV